MKICKTCQKEYRPTSRHLSCPKCRNKEPQNRKLCQCGKEIQKTSSSCITCLNESRTLEKNPNWKGRRWVHGKGYIMLRIPEHPRAVKSKAIFEHILVMEEYLGRYLYPGENIHHKNGIKDDNRIENLELWVKSQPSGIRAIDALKWAKEIIEIYQPIQDKLMTIEITQSSSSCVNPTTN